jgi:hypothetical protein
MAGKIRPRFPTRSDVRGHAAVLGICLALTYALNIATPSLKDRAGQIKGTDFANFYALGSLALTGQHQSLYDPLALRDYSTALLPELAGTYYLPIYGPQVALLFAPFSLLPYSLSLVLWIVLITAMFVGCCWLFWRDCPSLRDDTVTVVVVAVSAPAFFNLIAHGQNSAIALVCFTAAYFALRRERSFLAGLAIGSLVFKPQLGLVAACVFVLSREWRIIFGAVTGAAIQLGLAWLYFGSDVMIAYSRWLLGVGEINDLLSVKLYQMHSLYAFFKLAVPWLWVATVLYLCGAAICIWATYIVWRSRAPLTLRYAFLLLATALASPHLYVYDLVVLAPAFLIVVEVTLARPDNVLAKPMQQVLYLAYALPLTGVLAQATHLQLSVVAIATLAAMLFRSIQPRVSLDAGPVRLPQPV